MSQAQAGGASEALESSGFSTATRPLRVLVVEDNPADYDLAIHTLTRAGLEVESIRVDTPEAFLAAVTGQDWDVILADYSMPRFSATEALRLLHLQGIDLPFVIVSGSVGEDLAVEAMKAGAHDFFVKGRLTRLAVAVEREVREAETRSEKRRALEELARSQEAHRRAVDGLVDDLRAAVRVRDEFLSIASHELKTPITTLRLQLELLERITAADSVVLEGLREKVRLSVRQTTRLTTLINSLLDVTRITQGKIALTRETIDVVAIASGVLARAEEIIRRSGSKVTFVAPAPILIDGDAMAIENVITNLVDNALKYGNRKPIEVTVEAGDGVARIRVRDHGMGIAPSEQARIFERFERAVPHEHFGGFGLGLWVVRQIVEAHAGAVRVESREGEGSEFVVELPLRQPEPELG